MPTTVSSSVSPGYSHIIPILLGLASLVLFISCLPHLGRNNGFAPPDDAPHTARALDYVEDLDAAEGQVLELDLPEGSRLGEIVTTRDDRPWRTFSHGEEVRILVRHHVSRRGYVATEYIIDDFAAKWGGLLARAAAAVFCDIAAVAAMLLGRRRPSAALRFPPPLPRKPAG